VGFSGEYRYTDENAGGDIGFTARGGTLSDLFTACWSATLNVMLRTLDEIRREVRRGVDLCSGSVDMLLHDFLQELIYYKDAENLFLMVDSVTFRDERGMFGLRAELSGEKIDRGRHECMIDVKAVTFHRFRVAKTAGGWEARVVLDV
jgi:SHS2 domain-containing protein